MGKEGLGEADAEAMVGRTVQYAELRQERPGKDALSSSISRSSVSPSGVSSAHPAAVNAEGEVDVYIAFIWGFDPARKLLKAFENDRSTEVVRTFLVGREDQVESDIPPRAELPGDFPRLRIPVRPVWIGCVGFGDEL